MRIEGDRGLLVDADLFGTTATTGRDPAFGGLYPEQVPIIGCRPALGTLLPEQVPCAGYSPNVVLWFVAKVLMNNSRSFNH